MAVMGFLNTLYSLYDSLLDQYNVYKVRLACTPGVQIWLGLLGGWFKIELRCHRLLYMD